MPPTIELAPDARNSGAEQWSVVTALIASGLCLRPPLALAATLLPDISTEFHFDHTLGGLVTSIPVACMGLFALPATRLYGALGARAALTFALLLVVLGGAVRAAAPSATSFFALTIVAGIGAGLAGGLLPAIVRERLSGAPARATGLYSLGINGGAAVSAMLAVPLAAIADGWRGAFFAFGIAGLLSIVLTRLKLPEAASGAGSHPEPARPAWRRPYAYYLGGIFGLQAICFYGLNAWLASAYAEWGWTPLHASWLVAVLNFVTLPSSLLVGLIGDRFSRPVSLALSAGLLAVGVAGMVLMPSSTGWLWAAVAGLACGMLFPLILTMSVDAAHGPRDAGAVAGVTLAVGYCVASVAPVMLGAVRDLTHDFGAAFSFLLAVSLLLLLASFHLLRRPAFR
jgi:CP family cyanate transporter-like MFS transporter